MVCARACCACVRSRVRPEVWRGRSHPGALRRRGAATLPLLGIGALACVRRCVASLAAAHRCVVSMASGWSCSVGSTLDAPPPVGGGAARGRRCRALVLMQIWVERRLLLGRHLRLLAWWPAGVD
eukprot:7221144-Prymnesium_polylepis.1